MRTENRNRTIRIVSVDDDPNTQVRLNKILASVDDFELIGHFSNPDRASDHLPRLQPHLMLLGIRLPRLSNEYIKRFKRIVIGLKIVIVTAMANTELIESSLAAGAESCLIKPLHASQCLATLRFAGCHPMSNELRLRQSGATRSGGATSRSDLRLSRREEEVLSGLAEGLLYKEIADKLGLSYSAVHKYQHSLFAKLQVSNRSEAIRAWLGPGFNESNSTAIAFQVKSR